MLTSTTVVREPSSDPERPESTFRPFGFQPQTRIWRFSLTSRNPFPSRILRSTKMEAIVPEMSEVRTTPERISSIAKVRPRSVRGYLSP